MSKSISIDDSTYELIKEFAANEDRPISNAVTRLVKLGLEKNIKSETPNFENRSVSQAKEEDMASSRVQELLIKRSRVIRDLDERNIIAWVQKRASEEFWTDEQAQIEMQKYREKLEQERDALDAQLHELGV